MRALVLVVLLACGSKVSEETHAPTALELAKRLVARDFAGAHAMLAMPLTPAQLQTQFDQMMEPAGTPGAVKVMQTMTSWPDKQPDDLGWAYVAIEGTEGSEAITVVVTKTHKIRSIEWGRP